MGWAGPTPYSNTLSPHSGQFVPNEVLSKEVLYPEQLFAFEFDPMQPPSKCIGMHLPFTYLNSTGFPHLLQIQNSSKLTSALNHA